MGQKISLAKKRVAVKQRKDLGSLVNDYVARLGGWKQEVAAELRQVIRTASRELKEEVKWGWPCYTAGGKCICGFMDMRETVNFVLYLGAHLDDPHGLIEGTGKAMRHVKLRSLKDLRRPAFKR